MEEKMHASTLAFWNHVESSVYWKEVCLHPRYYTRVAFPTNNYSWTLDKRLIMPPHLSVRTVYGYWTGASGICFQSFTIFKFANFTKSKGLPSFRYLSS